MQEIHYAYMDYAWVATVILVWIMENMVQGIHNCPCSFEHFVYSRSRVRRARKSQQEMLNEIWFWWMEGTMSYIVWVSLTPVGRKSRSHANSPAEQVLTPVAFTDTNMVNVMMTSTSATKGKSM